MNTNKYLPIGTVVLLKNAKKKIMITGFAVKGKETGDKVYDYIGCLYPEGMVSSDKNLLFDHNQIDKIYYIGFVSEEEKVFKTKFNKLISDLEKQNKQEAQQKLSNLINETNNI